MKAEQIMARDDFKQCQSFHGHVCGGLAIGYLAATTGLAWLKRRRALDEELVAVVETDACCVDAIQVITGCTLGKGNLLLKDYGKMAFTFFNRQTGEGVRLSLRPDVLRPSERQRVLFGKQREGTLSAAEQAEFDDLGHQRTIDVLNTPRQRPVHAGIGDGRYPAKGPHRALGALLALW